MERLDPCIGFAIVLRSVDIRDASTVEADHPLQYRKACASLQNFVAQLIAKGKQDPSALGLMNEMSAKLEDTVQVQENLLELVLGGQNMTSSILGWALVELGSHPARYAQLRREIVTLFGSEGQSNATPMSWGNLQKCQMLQNVINETLRAYPPLANISKTAAANTVIPRGGGPDGQGPIAIPKGSTFTCSVYQMHRVKEVWGEDAG